MTEPTEEAAPLPTASNTFKIQPYSKAFENFVEKPDDTVGLLAYALFKQAINEDAARGVHTTAEKRDPGPRVVEIYRDSARRKLEEFGSRMVDEAKPTLQRSATYEALNTLSDNLSSVQDNLILHINEKTRMRYGVLASLGGWLLSIGFTILIVIGFYLPNWIVDITNIIKNYIGSPA